MKTFFEACDHAYRFTQAYDRPALVIKKDAGYISLSEQEAHLRNAPSAELTFLPSQSIFDAVDMAMTYHTKHLLPVSTNENIGSY